MSKILAAADFSDNSLRAAFYAAYIASLSGGTLFIVHVLDLDHNKMYQPFALHEKYNDLVILEREDELKHWEKMITNRYEGLKVKTEVVLGVPAQALASYAKHIQADFIVLGNTGAGKATRLMFGSVTDELFSITKTPLIAVPHEAATEMPGNMVFATNHFERDRRLLQPVVDLAMLHHSRLHIVFFMDADEDSAFSQTQYHRKLENYKKFIKTNYPNLPTKFAVVEGSSFDRSIEKYMAKEGAGLLVMVPYAKGFLARLRSSTRKMAFHSSVPLLALPMIPRQAKLS